MVNPITINKMKKLLFTLLLLAAASTTMSAYDFERYGIYYNVINGNEVSVVAGENQYSGNVHIPSMVYYGGTDYSVTAIGGDAFRNCYGLTLVSIPASVTTIEANAFAGCYGLLNIVCLGSVPPRATDIFGEDPYLIYQITVYAFNDVIENYYSDEFWGQFQMFYGMRYGLDVIFYESGDELTIHVFGLGFLEVDVNGRSAGTCDGALTYKMQRTSSNDFHVSVRIIQNYNGHSSASYYGYDSHYDSFTTLPLLYASEVEQGHGLKIKIDADGYDFNMNYLWDDGFDFVMPEYCIYRINDTGEWTRSEMGDSLYLPEYGDYTIEAYAGAAGGRCANSSTIPIDVHYGPDGFFSRCGRYIIYNGLYFEKHDYKNILNLYLGYNDPYGIMLPTLSDIVIPGTITIAGDEYTVTSVNRYNLDVANSITCLSATPIDASLGGYGEDDPFFDATLFVPQEGLEAYKTHEQWGKFLHIVPFIGAGPGDINGDGSIAIGDATNLIDMLLSGDELPAWADVNGDGEVTIKDITVLIDMLLNGNN